MVVVFTTTGCDKNYNHEKNVIRRRIRKNKINNILKLVIIQTKIIIK